MKFKLGKKQDYEPETPKFPTSDLAYTMASVIAKNKKLKKKKKNEEEEIG